MSWNLAMAWWLKLKTIKAQLTIGQTKPIAAAFKTNVKKKWYDYGKPKGYGNQCINVVAENYRYHTACMALNLQKIPIVLVHSKL